MSFYRHVPVAAITVAFMTATACSREPARTDQTATTATTATPATPATPAGQSAGSVDADWWTTTKVQAKFFADTGVKGRNINVDTNDGVVALRGEVDSAAAKERAVTLARQVDGVARVDDQLTVRPEHQADDARPVPTSGTTGANINAGWITTKIQAQYFADPDIKPWNIDVTTMANGHVTLRGEVDDANDRSKAVAIARNTEGVAAVDDKLRVRGDNEGAAGAADMPGGTEPDVWVTAKIQSKYFLDDDVKGRNIDVTTNDGVVRLSGRVDTEAQHRQAVALARGTEGVKQVDDRLQVSKGAPGASGVTPVRPVPGATIDNPTPDAWITTKIQSQYFVDPAVKMLAVNVDTSNGTVTLTGQVATDAERQAAERIAKDTDGVKRVVNRISIAKPGTR